MSLWNPLTALAAVLTAALLPLDSQPITLFWMWQKSGSLWQYPTQPGKLSTTHKLSPYPWEKSQAEKVSPGTELCCLGRGLTHVKCNCSSYSPLYCVQSQIYFCSNGMQNFCAELLGFHKGTLVYWLVPNLMFFAGKIVENSVCLGKMLRSEYASLLYFLVIYDDIYSTSSFT